MWDDSHKVDNYPTQSSPASAAPSTSRTRVALFCSEALRPVVCCVVDALEVRGYRVHLRCGRNAGAALQNSRQRRDADLRVVFIPSGLESGVRRKLQQGLDPDHRGDVLILPFDRPRDAIEAIECATGHMSPRRVRPPRPTRAVLTHATLVESKVDVRQWVRPTFAGIATVAALAALVVFSGPTAQPAGPVAGPSIPDAVDPTPVLPRSEGVTLAAVRPLPSANDEWDDESLQLAGDPYRQAIEDEEVIIITDDDEPVFTAGADAIYATPSITIVAPTLATAPFDRSILLDPAPAAVDPPAAAPHTTAWPASSGAGISRPAGGISLADPFSM